MGSTTTQEAESTNKATEAVRPFVPHSICQISSLRPLENPRGLKLFAVEFPTTCFLRPVSYDLFPTTYIMNC